MPRINISVPEEALEMIDAAAERVEENRSEFMVGASLRRATKDDGELTAGTRRKVGTRLRVLLKEFLG